MKMLLEMLLSVFLSSSATASCNNKLQRQPPRQRKQQRKQGSRKMKTAGVYARKTQRCQSDPQIEKPLAPKLVPRLCSKRSNKLLMQLVRLLALFPTKYSNNSSHCNSSSSSSSTNLDPLMAQGGNPSIDPFVHCAFCNIISWDRYLRISPSPMQSLPSISHLSLNTICKRQRYLNVLALEPPIWRD